MVSTVAFFVEISWEVYLRYLAINLNQIVLMVARILLIGLGPHSKRVYIKSLKKLGLSPTVIVDLESKKEELHAYLKEHQIPCELFCIPDEKRDAYELHDQIKRYLDALIIKHRITHSIISTEPKAHFAYLKYLIKQKIPVLTDKPITAPIHVCNDQRQAQKIQSEYEELLLLKKKYQTPVTVLCQRRYDPRYLWILAQVRQMIRKYGLPISHIQINHCDGSLNMPDEFFSRENHPYKYGYGKLFHSGYHFMDLLGMLLSYDLLPEAHYPTDCVISSLSYGPQDQLLALNESFYQKWFNQKNYREYYQRWRNQEYSLMGELDFLALIEFSKDAHVITTCSLNLLQSGFSRRAWAYLPKDTYKGNGRVRHESINLQIGPLMNIQVHSYQAYEVKERQNHAIDHQAAGGLEHFDIHIFRNSEIIGGLPYEVINGKDLFPAGMEKDGDFIGYNEYARHICFLNFLKGVHNHCSLEEQWLTINLVTHAYISMCQKRFGKAPISQFKLCNTPLLEETHDTSSELCGSLSC